MGVEQSQDDRVLLGVTPKGKEIYYMRHENRKYSIICFGSGGQLPKPFMGIFTSVLAAQKVVDSYLAMVNKGAIDELGKDLKAKVAKDA